MLRQSAFRRCSTTATRRRWEAASYRSTDPISLHLVTAAACRRRSCFHQRLSVCLSVCLPVRPCVNFHPHDATLARTLTALCLSLLVFYQNYYSDPADFLTRRLLSTYPTLRFKEILELCAELGKSRHAQHCIATCRQLSSTRLDAPSVINWTVVGQLSRQYVRPCHGRSTAPFRQLILVVKCK